MMGHAAYPGSCAGAVFDLPVHSPGRLAPPASHPAKAGARQCSVRLRGNKRSKQPDPPAVPQHALPPAAFPAAARLAGTLP